MHEYNPFITIYISEVSTLTYHFIIRHIGKSLPSLKYLHLSQHLIINPKNISIQHHTHTINPNTRNTLMQHHDLITINLIEVKNRITSLTKFFHNQSSKSYHKPLIQPNKDVISSHNDNQHDNKANWITISQSITSS